MTRYFFAAVVPIFLLFDCTVVEDTTPQKPVQLSLDELRDKIRGGWAGQTIGVTFGGPTEFRYNGTFIQDYVPLEWNEGMLEWWYENAPGLYDDIYMDLTFVDVIEREGLDAPATAFAEAFANADYRLWHANQMGRYNVLHGLDPPASGHWLNNPDADDIDFQIEADFAGLMSPGMPNAASEVSDTVGHIMNYGDGWYGGVYVAAMYALAFISQDVDFVVREALETIPSQTTFYETITNVIQWHQDYPDDWQQTWFEIQKHCAEDIGCPRGVFRPFNIDARVNAAYVVLGLLYGGGDFGKTLSIATRAGQDSDCNPATAAGVLGVMLGYDQIPPFWKQGLAKVEPIDFKYTTISLNDAYQLSFEHALENVRRNGGTVSDDSVLLPTQTPVAVRFEQSFEGHYPVGEVQLVGDVENETTFELEGIGFAVVGATTSEDEEEHVLVAEMFIDGELVESTELPTDFTKRKFVPFWRYQLEEGKHTVRIKIENPTLPATLRLEHAIIYGSAPVKPEY